MIGYEFEFLVREGDKPLSKAKFLEFHKILEKEGWKPKFDPDTGGLAGSYKSETFITCDDSVALMEINQAPTETIGESHENMTELLGYLKRIYQQLGCTIFGASAYPGGFDAYNPNCVVQCEHPDVSAKSFVKYIVPQRFGRNHHSIFVAAAHQVWLDVPNSDIVRQLRTFNRISPLLVAFFANGPIFNKEELGVLEGRDALWNIYLEDDEQKAYRNIYGMYAHEHDSLFSYFDFLLRLPFFYGLHDGLSFRLQDREITAQQFFFSDSSDAVYGNGKKFTAQPELMDFIELQHTTYPHIRLKFKVEEGVMLQNILDAYRSRDQERFLQCFSKFCIEVRCIGAQEKEGISIAPAFLLGLQQNIDEVAALAESRPYETWRFLYEEIQKKGLQAEEATNALGRLLDIARQGLGKRGVGEEKFLEPVRERLQKRRNPAQEVLDLWKRGGIDAIYAARDY